MITIEEVQAIAAKWRPRFDDDEAYETSYNRYFATAVVPDERRLDNWLAADFAKHEARIAGITKASLYPTRQNYDLGDCWHCGGKWYVRKDVPVSHPEFGKAFPCPSCNA